MGVKLSDSLAAREKHACVPYGMHISATFAGFVDQKSIFWVTVVDSEEHCDETAVKVV